LNFCALDENFNPERVGRARLPSGSRFKVLSFRVYVGLSIQRGAARSIGGRFNLELRT
jgi:hypothetical protein